MTPKQVAYRRWNASPKAKIGKAKYAEKHGAALAASAKVKYWRDRVPHVKKCIVEGCSRTWIVKPPAQRQIYCLDCAMFFQYPCVYTRRSDYRARRRKAA